MLIYFITQCLGYLFTFVFSQLFKAQDKWEIHFCWETWREWTLGKPRRRRKRNMNWILRKVDSI